MPYNLAAEIYRAILYNKIRCKAVLSVIMIRRLYVFLAVTVAFAMAACTDDDSFTTSSSARLTFSTDTVNLDTVFSTVPTSTHTFFVYNRGDDGLRIRTVRLARGNQSGYRVNVDGTYLDNSTGSVANDFEVRKGDSIRVFVELTSPVNNEEEPQKVQDELVFALESGVEQRVVLRAWSWDAQIIDTLAIKSDTTIASIKPVLVRRGISVDSAATLTVLSPTRLYFKSGAGIDVYGRLKVQGSADETGDVVFRGERTDRMFSYLPYDRVSGQWRGIRLHPTSTGNTIDFADIHSAEYGIQCDSAAYDSTVFRLVLSNSTIHNCKGYGLVATNSNVALYNSQLSNTLGDCLCVMGGKAEVVYCTLAQFYPFSANRGVALRFTNFNSNANIPLYGFVCYNSLITGYAEDEVMGESKDSTVAYAYYFANCIMRTPPVTDSTKLAPFDNVLMETPKDSVQGKAHFRIVDEDNLYYDFRLDSLSTAIGRATPIYWLPSDRRGRFRGDKPDIGCYQYEGE